MTKQQFLDKEQEVVSKMKQLAEERPETTVPGLDFKQDWAFGNAGLENESITREQVKRAIKE